MQKKKTTMARYRPHHHWLQVRVSVEKLIAGNFRLIIMTELTLHS